MESDGHYAEEKAARTAAISRYTPSAPLSHHHFYPGPLLGGYGLLDYLHSQDQIAYFTSSLSPRVVQVVIYF